MISKAATDISSCHLVMCITIGTSHDDLYYYTISPWTPPLSTTTEIRRHHLVDFSASLHT
jgi:hypothetical protein